MQIEIIAIGDEILAGNTVNTNASFISKHLFEKGYQVNRHIVIKDDPQIIADNIKKAVSRSNLVIVTGGLGPTIDDRTKKTVSSLFSLPLEYNKKIAEDLKKRFGNISSLKNQASILKGADYFINSEGTAPGLAIAYSSSLLIFLPGVPQEMKTMFVEQALGFIEEKFPIKEKIFEEKIFLCLLEELDVDPFIKKIYKNYPKVDIGIYPSYAHLQIRLKTKTDTKEEAEKILFPIKEEIIQEFKDYIFSFEKATIAEALHDVLFNAKIKIAFAESCSGGAMAKEITTIPGSSQYFLGSIVSYSNDFKKDILHVSENTLMTKGAVSPQTVKEMIKGIFSITKADYVVAISGIAGPSGGTKEKPVGTVCIGVGKKNEEYDVGTIHVKGSREMVVQYAVQFALCLLWKRIVQNKLYFEK